MLCRNAEGRMEEDEANKEMIRGGGGEEANKELATFLQRREEAQESRMARARE